MENKPFNDLKFWCEYDLKIHAEKVKTALQTMQKMTYWLDDMSSENKHDEYSREVVLSINMLIELVEKELENMVNVPKSTAKTMQENKRVFA